MKQSKLLSFILFAVLMLCFFSSAVLAGGGTSKDKEGTHPWDMDVIVADTTTVFYRSASIVQDSNPFVWPAFTLSYRFTFWLYYDEPLSVQTKQIEVSEKELSKRGTYSSKKLMR